MPKIAFVTDSNSGITQAQGKNLGVCVIPMPFMIDGKTYYEDTTLSQAEFYERQEAGADITTSQPTPEAVLKLWDRLLPEYEEIVHIPMSSALSGSCQTAKLLAEDYGGRVHVVNNRRISVTQRQSVLDGRRLAARGLDGAQIKQALEADKDNASIYIMLDTLRYLKKGGRITPAAAALGTVLRLKPVLQIQGGKLDAFAKARTSVQGKNLMLTAIKKDIENRMGGLDAANVWMQIAYTNNEEAAALLEKEVRDAFPGFDVHRDPLSLSIACHIGPGALAVACSKKMA